MEVANDYHLSLLMFKYLLFYDFFFNSIITIHTVQKNTGQDKNARINTDHDLTLEQFKIRGKNEKKKIKTQDSYKN